MRHRLQRKVFDGGENRSSSPQESRTSSTFTHSYNGKNPHLTKSNNKLHSKSTYFYRWGSRAGESKLISLSYLVPSVCALALLIGGTIALNPDTNPVYAEGEGDDTSARAADSSIALAFDGTPSFTEEVAADEVAYITNTFTVTAKKQARFTLQMTAMNGSGTNLHGKKNTAATIGGVGENVAPANFASNTWGYALNANTGAAPASLTYSSMPNYGTPKNVITENLTGAESESKSYLLAFAAKIGSDSPADHYIGNFLLSVVGDQFDPATYTLTYNANNGTGAPSSQSCEQTSVGATCNITVAAGTPTRNGYTFLGWGDNSTDTVAKYSAGNTITMDANKTIYAVWKSNGPFNGITRMDQMTTTICSAAKVGDTTQLIDDRDGTSRKYWVTKLADQNCWMTQNLDYDSGGEKITDLSTWKVDTITAAYYDPGNYYYNGPSNSHAQGNNCNSTTGLSSCNQFSTSGSDQHYHVGNYYSWPAAMNGNTSATGDVQGICSDGWKLPTIDLTDSTNSKGSFKYLFTQYGVQSSITNGSYAIYDDPLYFVYGGLLFNGQLSSSSSGYYWSSTSSDGYFYRLRFDGKVFPSGYYTRADSYHGCSVRCVAK